MKVLLCHAGEFFKFFPETVTTILDSDPIDVNVSHVKVSNLRHAIPFNEELLLFSDQTQFVMAGANILTPSNVIINATTEFESSLNAKPVSAGGMYSLHLTKETLQDLENTLLMQIVIRTMQMI